MGIVTRKMLSVHARERKAYIVPRAGLLSGSWEVGPVTIVDLNLDALVNGLDRALEQAPIEADPRYPNPWQKDSSSRTDPVLVSAGLKTRSAFERGTKKIDVRGLDDAVEVRGAVPDPKRGDGYQGIAWSLDLPSDATALHVARVILEKLPRTPSRPQAASREADPKRVQAISISALLKEASAYIADVISYDDLMSLVANGDERGIHRIIDVLTEFVYEELPDTSQTLERDQLKRIMAVIELLLRDGSGPIRDAVVGQFICTSVAMRKDVRAAAGSLTKTALKQQMSASMESARKVNT